MDRLEVHKERKKRKPIKKGVKITVTSVVFILAIAAFVILAHPVYVSDGSPTKIAESYFDKQFELSDYKVDDAAVILYDNARYIQVFYSAKPKERFYLEWEAGNGEPDENGWLNNKTAFIRCYQVGNIYFTGLSAYTGL